MAGLPKKYAKMGFARGWRAYKASRGRVSHKTKTTATTAGRMGKMAKRRGFKRYRRSSSRSTGGGSVMSLALAGAMYGVVREPVNQLAKNIPMIGGFGDEVVLGLISMLAASKGKGWVKTIGRAGVVIEAHNLSRNMTGGLLSGFLGSTTSGATTSSVESFK